MCLAAIKISTKMLLEEKNREEHLCVETDSKRSLV